MSQSERIVNILLGLKKKNFFFFSFKAADHRHLPFSKQMFVWNVSIVDSYSNNSQLLVKDNDNS